MSTTLEKAFTWINNNTIDNHGITVTNRQRMVYPEVTGYYIPTLLEWNKEDLAYAYADYLCSIQKDDGSWYDPRNIEPYIFDSCQILKGLVAISKHSNDDKYKEALRKGCDFILSQINEEGRLVPCREDCFEDMKGYSELIHTYCLSPLKDASDILDDKKYAQAAEKCLNYYIDNFEDKILDFHLLAHFYAYVMEAMCDMNKSDIAKKAMDKIAAIQRDDGMIPAYNDVNWTCSTALFQFAVTWFKLGETDRAIKTYNYACSLQNESGGWFGRYPKDDLYEIKDKVITKLHLKNVFKNFKEDYFPHDEISWAVKYFLDATMWKNKLEANK